MLMSKSWVSVWGRRVRMMLRPSSYVGRRERVCPSWGHLTGTAGVCQGPARALRGRGLGRAIWHGGVAADGASSG